MLLRKILGLDRIYGRRYAPALFFDFIYPITGSLVVIVAVGLLGGLASVALLLPVLLFILLAIFYAGRQIARSILVDQIIYSRRYETARAATVRNAIEQSAVSDELNSPSGQWFQVIEMKTKQVVAGSSWQIYDILCDTHNRYWGLRLKSGQTLYTVFEAKLCRPTPHLVFNARRGRSRQFKRFYVRPQKLVLGVGIDDYFSAYSTGRRRAETLDLLTADVKLALLALRDYDLELVDGILFCYAPLLPEEDLETFRRRCRQFQHAVDGRLPELHYDHLDGDLVQGDNLECRLLGDPWAYFPPVVVAGAVLFGLILAAIISGSGEFLKALPIFAVAFIYYAVKLARIMHRNSSIVRDMTGVIEA